MRTAWALLTIPLAAACAPAAIPAPEPDAGPVVAPVEAEPRAASILEPIDPSSRGAVVLGRALGRTIAYVADADSNAIYAADLDARTVVSTTVLTGAPSSLMIARDGTVFATIRDRAEIVALDATAVGAPLVRRAAASTPDEPVTMASSPDGETIFVASRWGHAITAFAAGTLERRFTVEVPRDPTALALDTGSKTLYVAHATGGLASAIDLQTLAVREIKLGDRRGVPEQACGSAFAGGVHPRILEHAFALIRRRDGTWLMPAVMADTIPIVSSLMANYGGQWWSTEPSMTFAIASVRASNDAPPAIALSPARGLGDCLLPRAAALDESSEQLLVACVGRDEINAYDATGAISTGRVRKTWKVGAGPLGITIDQATKRAIVWSQFDGTIDILDLAHPGAVQTISTPHHALAPDLDLGRRLFHAANNSRVAFDGRACASCHLDARDDSLTWITRDGPRQTPMLLGRLADTAPYGWTGADATLQRHFHSTLDRLGGTGLSPKELDAVFAWVQSLSAPITAKPPSDLLARGKELFTSDSVGCASCHSGALATDRASHDVSTGSRHDPGMFDTPSLRFVAASAPYLHDGRYATVRELLTGMDSKMGFTKQLSDADKDALAAYVESL